MWIVALVVMIAGVIGMGVWTARRQSRMSPSHHDNDRLGIRDPRDTPWGPPTGL